MAPIRSEAKVGDLVWINSHPACISDRIGVIVEVITIPHPSWESRNERMYAALVDGALWTLASRKQFDIL
jgi:hypothetical protein